MSCGVYKISSLADDKIYIGSSSNIDLRKNNHFVKLRIGTHTNKILQNFFNKYGEEKLKFEVIEFCEEENLLKREQYYLDLLKPKFNILKIAGRSTGYKHTEETKSKNSSAHIGNKSRLGKINSEETKDKIKKSLTGKNHTEETKKLMSLSHKGNKSNTGRFLTDEHKENIRKGMLKKFKNLS